MKSVAEFALNEGHRFVGPGAATSVWAPSLPNKSRLGLKALTD
jgi:hypothetical protein